MPTTIGRTELLRILAAVSKVVDTCNTIPLLSHVLIESVDGRLTVRGTDLDIQAEGTIAADGDLAVVAVPGRDLDGIVRRLAGTEVVLEMDGEQLIVRSGRSKFKLPTLPVDGFPMLGVGDFLVSFTADLAGLTSQVSFAAGAHSQHPMLVGTYVHVEAGQLVAVATDGKRMARAVGDDAPEFPGVILPPKLLAHIPAGAVQVEVGENRIRLSTPHLVVVSKLIEAKYPAYQKLWPADFLASVTVNRRELKEAAERVALVSDENLGRGVRFSVVSGAVNLSVRSHTRGEANEEVAAIYSGDEKDWGFNCSSLAEMLGAIPGEEVTFNLAARAADIRGSEPVAGVLTYFELGSAA
jgi:DNA polymerase-3 subunit beta